MLHSDLHAISIAYEYYTNLKNSIDSQGRSMDTNILVNKIIGF